MRLPRFKKLRFDLLKLLRKSYSITIFIVIIALIFVIFFLYNNVYQTLDYAKIVTNLKQKVTSEYINVVRYEDIISKIQSKRVKPEIDIESINDPFKNVVLEPEDLND